MESDSQITIHSIIEKIKAPSQMSNLIRDITSLAKSIRNIQFTYCDRLAKKLADNIAKRSHNGIYQNDIISYTQIIFLSCLRKEYSISLSKLSFAHFFFKVLYAFKKIIFMHLC